ncbi:MAG: hypothetical protein ACLFV4_12025 [Candidatus Hydrogenedentota bacterium]
MPPLRLRMDLIEQHTLVNPDRIRLWPGWTHLEMATGRYSKSAPVSPLFEAIQQDLLEITLNADTSS